MADLLARSTFEPGFDNTKGEILDTPDKKIFSQHANIFAMLSNAVPKALGILDDMADKVSPPNGEVKVNLKRQGKIGISGELTLPSTIKGVLFGMED